MLDIKLVSKCIDKLDFKFPYSAEEWAEKMYIENQHKHTTWSNPRQIDSGTSLEEFFKINYERGAKLYFSGEHGTQGNWLRCYDMCHDKKLGEKLGIELPRYRHSTEAYWVKDRHIQDNKNCHIVIVARNYNASRKLNYILSVANETLEKDGGFYNKPRIDLELIKYLTKDDVYVMSACVGGWKYEDADDIWLDLAKHFGDSFFFEYQAHNTTQQKELNKHIQDLAKKYNIKTIIGLDTHVISDEDNVRRDNLLKRKGLHYDDEEGWYLDYPDGKELFRRMKEQGVLSDEEIIVSMMNTHIFVDGCEDFTLDKDFKIPILPKNQNLTYDERVQQLNELIKEKYSKEEIQTQDRYDGMIYEMKQIAESTTADYFIMNHDIVYEATHNRGGILTKSSRGSASSYYTSKLLGFTNMDRFESEVPVFPERFITKDRILSSHQCPDIDYNIAEQQPFLDASRHVLGGYHTCYPLVAFGKISEKSGWKLYADIKGIPPSVANAVSKDIDKYLIAYSNAEDEDKKDIKVEDYISKEYAEIFNDSIYYRGIIDGAKQHACGHLTFNGNPRQKDVVGYGDIRYEFGLIRCKSESTGKSVICANVEGSYLDAYGYVKNDYLIVAVVSLIDKIYKALKKETPSVSQLRKMVQDDESTWKLYEMGATLCLNQCEKDSTTKKVMTYKPKNIRELTAFIAGIRPGFRSLINTLLTRTPYSTGEEAIDKILEDSFHFMLYQEAIMKIFTYLGIPMKDSYDTIKGISKKKLKGEKLKHVEDNLKEHWLKNIGNMDNFEKIYQVIKDSSKYSFNAPHANAMAIDSLYVAYPKAHFTDVFYEVALNHHQERGEKDKVNALLVEAINFFDYKIGEYEYGKDNSKFTVDKKTKTIYPSLASVKGIGSQAVVDMMNIYESGKDNIVDIYLAIKGTKVNKSTFQKLIKIGYFKKYGSTKQLLSILEIVDKWKGSTGTGRKSIPKTAIKDLGLENIDIYKYATDVTKSGKVSDKQFTNVDWIGIAKELASKVPTDEYKLGKLIKNEYEVLGYINRKDSSIDKRYIVVTNLDTTWSPKFEAYCINNGKTCEMKIHNKSKRKNKEIKTYFQDIPIEEGDILYMKAVKKDIKKKMIDGEFVEEEGMYDWWINDYIKVTI